jgi:GTP pyrophosphokinase
MVSVTHAVANLAAESPVKLIAEGLGAQEYAQIEAALTLAEEVYEGHVLGTGEAVYTHAVGMALIAASLRLDVDTRVAALLFALHEYADETQLSVLESSSPMVALLVEGLHRLNGLRLQTRRNANATAPEIRAQTEVLRKMVLGMVQDIRVVLLRLASRTQTLRYYTEQPSEERIAVARESLDIYAPLANRLGVWQLKWELEDLSFRFLEPDTYKRIAKMLDERRSEREEFIQQSTARLKQALDEAGIKGEVYGRPKHIYSIYNKMRSKGLDFSQVYDIRAVRVLVDKIEECYTVLDIVNRLWQPIAKEYDDYISKPKGNNYQSLHTAVRDEAGRALEVQIRTYDMHRHAELGVAAHWRYKEGTGAAGGDYDNKIALLRNLLSWRDQVADAADWVEQIRNASLDDTIYVITPQGDVIDLPRGATPIDYAYRLHTTLGHRCRGAKVDGQLVPLNTRLENGQTVEIVAAKEGGPSRDWLNPQQSYIGTNRARNKIRLYFSQLEEEDLLTRGRSFIAREMQREGHSQANIDALADKLGFKTAEAMFLAAGRGEIGPRAVQTALREPSAEELKAEQPEMQVGRSRTGDTGGKVLVVGVGKLLTSLSRCCKPAPPDMIQGFVTRGRGVSIHRIDCADFKHLAEAHPERVVEAEWNEEVVKNKQSVFQVEIEVTAMDRQGLLRDISEVLSRERFNVIAVNTLSKKGKAHMRFTMEVGGVEQMQRALSMIREVNDVVDVRRR